MAVSVGQVVTDCSCVSVPLKVCYREQKAYINMEHPQMMSAVRGGQLGNEVA